jgi:hypothetical protein
VANLKRVTITTLLGIAFWGYFLAVGYTRRTQISLVRSCYRYPNVNTDELRDGISAWEIGC